MTRGVVRMWCNVVDVVLLFMHGLFAQATTCTPGSTQFVEAVAELEAAFQGSGPDCVEVGVDMSIRSTLQVANGRTLKVLGGGAVLDGNQTQIFSVLGHLILENLTVQNGFATTGGAITVESGGTLEVRNAILQQNVASESGGAVWSVDASSLVFEDCLFQGNVAQGSGGGAGHITGTLAEASYNFSRCWFTSHVASSGQGGALRFQVPEAATIEFHDVIFENNTADYSDDLWTDVSLRTTVNMFGTALEDISFDILYGTCGSSCSDPAQNYGAGAGCTQVLPFGSGWLMQLGSGSEDQVKAVGVDIFGNVVLTGFTTGLMGSTQHGGSDVLVVKLNSAGSHLWTSQLGSSGDEAANALHLSSDAIYVAGWTRGSSLDLWLAKLGTAGATEWTWDWGTSQDEEVLAVQSVDSEIFLAGYTYGSLPSGVNAGGKDAFIAKIDSTQISGNFWLWDFQIGSNGDDEGRAMHFDVLGNVLVAGTTTGSFDFNTHQGGRDIFVLKIASSGWPAIWSYQCGSTGDDDANAMLVDSAGNIFVAGQASGSLDSKYHAGGKDIIATKLDANGAFQWTYQIGTSSDEEAMAIQFDAVGNVILAGYGFGGLDGYVLAGAEDVFLQNVHPDGYHTWTRMMGSAGGDRALGLSLDAMGNAVMGGYIATENATEIFARKVTGVSPRTCFLCFPCYYCSKGQYRSTFVEPFNRASDCEACPSGAFQALDTWKGSCSVCPAGTHQPALGALECIGCPDGRESAAGSACCPGYELKGSQCQACGHGYFDSGSCEVCPAGKYAEQTGLLSCAECGPGKYLDDDGLDWKLHVLELACSLCPLGRFSNISAAGNCSECEPGTFSGTLGATACEVCSNGVAPTEGRESCSTCVAGTGPNADGTECEACAVGFYSTSGTCEHCASGRVSTALGTSCDTCPAGTYAVNASCVACPEGTISSPGATSCSACPRGRVPGANSSACNSCLAGTFAAAGSASCTSCSAGYFSHDKAFECIACRPGTISSNGSDSCVACKAGQYPNAAQDQCEDCPAGKKRETYDKYCIDCAVGEYSLPGMNNCSSCPSGMYSLQDRTACQTCQSGRYSQGMADTCDECPAGTVPDTGQSSCENCLPGKYSVSGHASCSDCPAGRYAEGPGTSACSQCLGGSYSAAIGANSSSTCAECWSSVTLQPGSTNSSDCIEPMRNQFFECAVGKRCSVSGFEGSGLVNSHSLAVKEECLGASAVSGFGSDGSSEAGSTAYTWSSTLSAQPGTYRLCWCGGTTSPCTDVIGDYVLDVGTFVVAGPYSSQSFYCVRGQICSIGPLLGEGLTAEDQVFIREGCTLDVARAKASKRLEVSANGSGPVDLYLSYGLVEESVPAGIYSACWCSSIGPNCSQMNLTATATSAVYLEHTAASWILEGPGMSAEIECLLGSECFPQLPKQGAMNLAPGDRATALEMCGSGNFIGGLPGSGIAGTADGYSFAFLEDNSSMYLESDPGFFRFCWCRLGGDIQCNKPADFNVFAGILVAAGPYSNQRFSCSIGSQCILQRSELRGIQLDPGDALLPMAACGGSEENSLTFPRPLPIPATVNGSDAYFFDFGRLEASINPELVHVCWCSAKSIACHRLSGFRQLAIELLVECPPGWYELPTERRECHLCPIGHYCPGGWLASRNSCPAGSTAPEGSVVSDHCVCRQGFYWNDAGAACLPCPMGFFKDTVSREVECASACPNQTTSARGAASLSQCFCPGGTIDINPSPDDFQCVEFSLLSGNSSDDGLFATSTATAFSFDVSLLVADASSEGQVRSIRQRLQLFLEVLDDSQVSLVPEVRFDDGWYVDFAIWSSQMKMAEQLCNQFDGAIFDSWVPLQAGTAVDSAQLLSRTQVRVVNVTCPDGLGVPAGFALVDVSDCKCPHGKEPSVLGSSAVSVGCTQCQVGRYKASVGDNACDICSTPLTTLQAGAISPTACTFICLPGYYNADPQDPSVCHPCGHGFHCFQSRRTPCPENKTTTEATSTDAGQCLCALGLRPDNGPNALCSPCRAGRYRGTLADEDCTDCAAGSSSGEGQAACTECAAGHYSVAGSSACEACPSGRYLESTGTSLDTCELCPLGFWGGESGADSAAVCQPCVSGSTTALPGAGAIGYCMHPRADHAKTCVSGRVCTIDGISGSSLQEGHHMAIASRCPPNQPVIDIVDSGISMAALQGGSAYTWGSSFRDFTPLGGTYSLCWCANLNGLACDYIEGFLLPAGHLSVIGPFYHQLSCLRGSDCVKLAFQGFQLLASDQVAVRRGGCGGDVHAQVSEANVEGLGSLEAKGNGGFMLGFGESTATAAFYFSIDASHIGYSLCWCGSQRGFSGCRDTADYAVDAGRLHVVGPHDSQESACFLGQRCEVRGLIGVEMHQGDRLMLLSDCGKGKPIPGVPANGILETRDGSNFAFRGDADGILLSVPGMYRMCYCRPQHMPCEASSDFQGKVGFMTTKGPFERRTICEVGDVCDIEVLGVGLSEGDMIALVPRACGTMLGLGGQGYPDLQEALVLASSGAAFEVRLGMLPAAATPGLYSICWCAKGAEAANCTEADHFQAPAGQLQVDCPPGTFAVGPLSGASCARCTRGFYCAGGRPASAARVACQAGRTTLNMSSVSDDACICDHGFRLEQAVLSCVACDVGFYKDWIGDDECHPCPDGETTFARGSISASSCYSAQARGDHGNETDDRDDANDTKLSNSSDPSGVLAGLTKTEVPGITFNMSVGGLLRNEPSFEAQLVAVFASTIAASARTTTNSVRVELLGLPSQGARRLGDVAFLAALAVITINKRTREEAVQAARATDVNTLASQLSLATQEHSTLAELGIAVVAQSIVTPTLSLVVCALSRAVPPGVLILSPADCECTYGYGWDLATQACEPCRHGEYKGSIGNVLCTKCPALMTTPEVRSWSQEQCDCEEGLTTFANGSCSTCPRGSYCPGESGQAFACPANSTTIFAGTKKSDCVCTPGHFFASEELWCKPCPRARYKMEVGNGECALTCPTNADSELASTSPEDCFCRRNFHAVLANGKLESCRACSYEGLVCPGGWEAASLNTSLKSFKVHAQPLAVPGYYQTGNTLAVGCNVLQWNGSSVCGGGQTCLTQRLGLQAPEGCHGAFGNACANGSSGVLCGECAAAWGRERYPQQCQRCPATSAPLLGVAIISDILTRSMLSVVVATMAATTAVKGSVKLHTSMIRIGSQWLAACSVLGQFSLERLPGFEWAQTQARMNQLQECATSGDSSCPVEQQVTKFAWPEEVTDVMRDIFGVMTIVPELASVDFSMTCHAEELAPGDTLGKIVAPGVYYICSPFLAMFCSLMICATMTYLVIPFAQALGIQTNNVDEERRAKEKATVQLRVAIQFVLSEHGLKWRDLQDAKILTYASVTDLERAAAYPDTFIEGTLAFCKPLALKMCMHRLQSNLNLAHQLHAAGMTWKDFSARPSFLAMHVAAHEGLAAAAMGKIPDNLLLIFVLRAFAWKLFADYKTDLDRELVADRVANARGSILELQNLSENKILLDRLVRSLTKDLRSEGEMHRKTVEETESLEEMPDPAALDLGLFTSMPRLRDLLGESVPVLWITLMGMWPELLAKFLQMVWCASIFGEVDGRLTVDQRLLPHPDVVCWSNEHAAMASIACIGLVVWCAAVPLGLFYSIYRLKDRHSSESLRKFGYFIQGYEPEFWWWDILVKRADIGMMNIVTYTSMTSDEKAKLLVFPFLSGGMLAIANWYQPYANTQGELLDVIEMSLLSFRFFLFSMVAILLIFHPSTETTFAWAVLLVVLLASAVCYFGLHVLVQLVRRKTLAEGDEDISDSDESLKPRRAGLRELALALLSPLQESEDEKLIVQWCLYPKTFHVLNVGRGRQSRAVAMVLKLLRSWIFRFGHVYQKHTVAKALDEFTFMWLERFGESALPGDMVQVLAVLTSSSKYVSGLVPPEKLAGSWLDEVRRLLNEPKEHAMAAMGTFLPDELLDTIDRLGTLSPEEAMFLVNETEEALEQEIARYKSSLAIDEVDEGAKRMLRAQSSFWMLKTQSSFWMEEPDAKEVDQKQNGIEAEPEVKDQAVQTALTKPVAPMHDGFGARTSELILLGGSPAASVALPGDGDEEREGSMVQVPV